MGIGLKKKEGDFITPIGDYKIKYILYRPTGVIKSPSFFFKPIPLLPTAHFTLY